MMLRLTVMANFGPRPQYGFTGWNRPGNGRFCGCLDAALDVALRLELRGARFYLAGWNSSKMIVILAIMAHLVALFLFCQDLVQQIILSNRVAVIIQMKLSRQRLGTVQALSRFLASRERSTTKSLS